MARQRFIHPEFWTDPSIGQLRPLERLFFIGCFSNADDEGRLLGNPAFLRSTVFPYDDISLEEIITVRDRVVAQCRNLVLYVVDGVEYLAFTKWTEYQKPKYPKPSKLPPPPSPKADPKPRGSADDVGESLPQNGGKASEGLEEAFHHGLGRDGLGLDRDGLGGGTGEPTDQPTRDLTTTERAILHELQAVKGYPLDYTKDLEYIRSLAIDFPTLDLLAEVKRWRTYKQDKPLKPKSNPRLQFRNWCEIAKKRAEEKRARDSPYLSEEPPEDVQAVLDDMIGDFEQGRAAASG